MALMGKKILMIIPEQNFRDDEFEEIYKVLRQFGASVTVGSVSMTEATGLMGLKVKPDVDVYNVSERAFDAFVFIGGPGVRQYFIDRKVIDLAQQAFLRGKIVAAISFAPSILANAGILEKKDATSSLTEQGNLAMHGARYTGRDLEVAGNVITAKDHKFAGIFAQAIARELFNQ